MTCYPQEAEKYIAAILNDSATITNIVGTRIFGSVPTTPVFPFIVFVRTDTEPYYTLAHPTTFEKTEFTISIWADDHPTVLSLATAVKRLLKDYRDECVQGIFFVRQVSTQLDVEPLKVGIQQVYNVYS